MLRVLPVPGGILVVEFDAEGGMSVRDERQEVVEFSAERQGAAEAALAAATAAVEAHGSARVAMAEVAKAGVAETALPPRGKPVGRARVRTTTRRPSRSPGRRAPD